MKEQQKKIDEKMVSFFILAADEDGAAPKMIQILPAGWVETAKGKFLVDDVAMESIVAAFDVKKNDTVIDYEHQTLKDVIAPAAAWIKRLVNRGKEGLWGEVEWTPRALEFVRNKEYRYLSPVIFARKSDCRAIRLHSCGLTNTPAIDGMNPIANKETEESCMEFLKMVAGLLGLPETATEDEVKQKVMALKQQTEESGKVFASKEILSLLDLPDTASLTDAKGKIIALKNPSGFVKAEEFQALQEKLACKERDDLVELAMKDGKVAPAQKEWAQQYALKDPDGFRAFVTAAPKVVPIGGGVAGGKHDRQEDVDEVQMSVNKALGLDNDTFKKFGGDK